MKMEREQVVIDKSVHTPLPQVPTKKGMLTQWYLVSFNKHI